MADAWQKRYRSTVSQEPIFSSNFDIYFDENNRTLTYIRESCRGDDIVPTIRTTRLPSSIRMICRMNSNKRAMVPPIFYSSSPAVWYSTENASWRSTSPSTKFSRIYTGQNIPSDTLTPMSGMETFPSHLGVISARPTEAREK